MQRRVAILAGSLLVHAGLGALLGSLDRPAQDDRPAASLTVVEIVPPAPSPPSAPSARPGGGVSAATRTPRAAPARRRAEPLRVRDAETTTTIEPGGGTEGHGNGIGDGRGDGIGIGGGRLAALLPPVTPVPEPPPAPGPPPVSKARPARLIYPSRQVQIEEALLFKATLVVDSEGFVAGAHLTRGFGGPRDDLAASAVWRFRYAPALDEAGQPIRSTVEQHFMVQ